MSSAVRAHRRRTKKRTKRLTMRRALYGLNLEDAPFIIRLDNYLYRMLTTPRWPQWMIRIMKAISRLGDGYAGVLLGLSFYVFGVESATYYFLRGLSGGLLCILVFVLIKNTVHRTRPFERHTDRDPHMKPPDKYSFPSGHTMFAFSMIFTAGPIHPALIAGIIVFAILVALSRVIVRVHYPLDVIGGAIFGSLVGIGVDALARSLIVLPL